MRPYNIIILLLSFLLTFCNSGLEDKHSNSDDHSDTSLIQNQTEPKKGQGLKSKVVSSKFSTDLLFGPWTTDLDGPHADFLLSKDSYFIVDYDGDGNILYEISHDTLKLLRTPSETSIGIIERVTNDTLIINWDSEGNTTYVRWTR